ncbi:hypothetical protein DFH11DRAFT_1189833 [Phellopilus nigrolimitatus]|nr:hypothetical protein DFH11DRAFT_1189833 [Phellopilus nigrolimitatus]
MRPLTPAYINSISTREQYANGSSSRALPRQHGLSHARSAAAVTGGGTGSCGSSMNEEDLLDCDGDRDVKEDALLDGEGEGEGEGDMDIDAEIARAANGPSSSLSSLAKLQIQSPLKTMQLSYPALSVRQYHDIHSPGINALASVAASARGELGKHRPMLPSVATMDHTHAVSRVPCVARARVCLAEG